MVRLRRLPAATAVAALVLLAAGCEDEDPEPRVSPTPSVSTSSVAASPSDPATSGSTTPEAETAEEFIRRWAQLETEMQNTGDTAAYRAITRGCQPCAETADLVERYYGAGGFIEFGGHEILRVSEVRPASAPTYRVREHSMPTRYQESADGEIKTFDGGTNTLQFTLEQSGTSWNVIDLVQIAS